MSWAVRSGLEPIKKVAGTIKDHLWEILNAVVLEVNNGSAVRYQKPNQYDQSAWQRFPQQGAICQCNLLPSWRAESLS